MASVAWMAFLDQTAMRAMGFTHIGDNVLISDRAAIYNPAQISIGDHSRIDDFCVLAGRITIGRYVHISVFNNLAGGRAGIVLDDFAGLAYGCHIVAQSDDYSGATMTNPTVPAKYKSETSAEVRIGRHCILGTGSVVLPGVSVAEGTSCGAMTLLNKSTEPWSIYVGSPARRVKDRDRGLLELERQLLDDEAETLPLDDQRHL